MLRLISCVLVCRLPVISTSRTNCCRPSWMTNCRSTRCGSAAGVGIPLEGRVRKAVFEILRQDGVAVHGHVEFAERLARRRS